MGIKVNLAGVSTEMEVLPKGRYLCNVYNIEAKTASTGTPMLTWIFKVSPEHPDPQYTGRQIYHNTTLTEKSMWVLKRTLIALGDDPTDLDQEIEFEPDDYLGRACVIEITHRQYQGRAVPNVNRLLPEDAPLDEDNDVSSVFGGDDVL